MRTVLDTNVIVSGILSERGAARALLDLARGAQMELVTSTALLDELQEVLGRFVPHAAAGEIRAAFEEMAYVVEPGRVRAVTRDPDDDHVLAAALYGGAVRIVTRDEDLLTLGEYEGIAIVPPAQALAAIRRELQARDSE